MIKLIIARATVGVSLQDGGRFGYLRYGVAPAGPMDWARHAMANQMLGKSARNTTIEVGPSGLALNLMAGQLPLSFAGPRFTVMLDGIKLRAPLRLLLKAGQQLEILPEKGAMWGYIGIGGKLDEPLLLGSQSENSASGLAAKKITTGDVLNISKIEPPAPERQSFFDSYTPYEAQPIGILPAAQYDDFSKATQASLVSQRLMIEARFDRMAYRLKGVQLTCEAGHDIMSDGVTMGSVQVLGDGQPLVLMADHQTTGGYPKIATICAADMPRFAQMAPGKQFTLRWVTMDEALKKWSDIRQQIESLAPLSYAP